MAPQLPHQLDDDQMTEFFELSLEKKTAQQPSWMMDIRIPPESLQEAFHEDYKKEIGKFHENLAYTSDHHEIEDFVSAAHSLVRRWLPHDLIVKLERFIHDPSQPSALIIRGLAMDAGLPPSNASGLAEKYQQKKFLSETWLLGITHVVGQPFTVSQVAGGKTGIPGLVRSMFPIRECLQKNNSMGSRQFLDFHSDFFDGPRACHPPVIAILGLRGDSEKVARTLVCDFRQLYSKVSQADVTVLREQKITWVRPDGTIYFEKFIIEGPEMNPKFNIFVEDYDDLLGFENSVRGSAEAKAAYKRVKDLAREVGCSWEGAWLDSGDMLLLNQRRTAHARPGYDAKFDGRDRWLQKVYSDDSSFWEPLGSIPWPVRIIPPTI